VRPCPLLTAILALSLLPMSLAAQSDRDLSGLHSVKAPISLLDPPDRHEILRRLQIVASNLHGEAVLSGGQKTFFVQAFGQQLCGGTGNCNFWVFDSNHRILLRTVAQQATYLNEEHDGRRDVLTSFHGSAFESQTSRWQFDGRHYRRSGCTTINFNDGHGDFLKKPRVTSGPCW
jgi:hypothetical protein